MSKIPMTVQGATQLKDELEALKRESVVNAQLIATAREYGDLRENAEYKAAREKQGFCQGRIQEIEHKLACAQIIDISKTPRTGKIVFGVTVSLYNVTHDKSATYQIVGDDEADIKQEKISILSPLGRALIGKVVGDEATVDAPSGKIVYEVLALSY